MLKYFAEFVTLRSICKKLSPKSTGQFFLKKTKTQPQNLIVQVSSRKRLGNLIKNTSS